MKRLILFLVIILGGAGIGYWGMQENARRTAISQAIDLFERHCGPFWQGDFMQPKDGFGRTGTFARISWAYAPVPHFQGDVGNESQQNRIQG
ncbi:MAG: hypothetical protein GJ676_14775 [Rhodobacteraceae bacterium]|nr:hypothetical protein [Paracoccaceae bacterium]